MNSFYQVCRWLRRIATIVACIAITGCAGEEAADFCENHSLFHDEHRKTTAALSINMSESGDIVSEITLPMSLFDHSANPSRDRISRLTNTLEQSLNVYTLQTERECRIVGTAVSQGRTAVTAHYESHCGSDNKLKQLDVTIFEAVPELKEVIVVISTPVTSKRFAINRRCDNAIFRIDRAVTD